MNKREGSRTLLWATRLLDHRWSLGILPGSPLGVWLKKRDKATTCVDIFSASWYIFCRLIYSVQVDIFSAGWWRWHHHMDRVGPCCSVRLKIRCFPPTLSLTVLFSSTFPFLCVSSLHLMGEFNSWSRTSHPFVGKDFGRSANFFCLFAIDLPQNSKHDKPAVLSMAK